MVYTELTAPANIAVGGVLPMQSRLGNVLVSASVFFAMIVALSVFSDRSCASRESSPARRLVVLFTGDDMGNIKPCG